MITAETKLKAWGNSIGVVIPKKELNSANLGINDEVEISIKKKTNVLDEIFGMGKPGKISTEEILKEINEELDPEI
jgi:antitoxin component of MazEF toxin-antitoxin module